MELHLKRAYTPPAADDGIRVLVDRIWPRGLKKENARIDWWPKEIAPSTELRRWFGHDPDKWDEFKRRYFRELDGRDALLSEFRERGAHHRLTLVFAAKDEAHNNAAALKEYLEAS